MNLNITIEGTWYEQGSAARLEASLNVEAGRYTLKTQTDIVRFGDLDEINVSDRLGNVERKLTLADGSVFASKDNASIDSLFKSRSTVKNVIHTLEANLGWAIVAVMLSVACGFAFFKWGIPTASHAVAHALPQKTGDLIGGNTLKFLDEYLFDESSLDETQQESIREHFESVLLTQINASKKIDSQVNYTLHFRAWGEDDGAIPNALALPSGDIILTDKFVELSQSQDEIDSVLLHEIGHVEHRHSLEMLVQSTLVTTAVTLFTGDASGTADMGIGLGSLLLSTGYSRGYESEADQYAFEQMLIARIDPTSFASIMERITSFAEGDDLGELSSDENETEPLDDDDVISSYLSTHPSTANRIKQAKHYAKCYKKGLIVCDALQF